MFLICDDIAANERCNLSKYLFKLLNTLGSDNILNLTYCAHSSVCLKWASKFVCSWDYIIIWGIQLFGGFINSLIQYSSYKPDRIITNYLQIIRIKLQYIFSKKVRIITYYWVLKKCYFKFKQNWNIFFSGLIFIKPTSAVSIYTIYH